MTMVGELYTVISTVVPHPDPDLDEKCCTTR